MPELLSAEQLMYSDPDSALGLMDSIESKIITKHDSALAYYMKIRIYKMLNIYNIYLDSAVTYVTDFYSDDIDPRHAMWANYYAACYYYDRGNYTDAVKYALEFKPYAENFDDHFLLCCYYDLRGNVSGEARKYDEAAHFKILASNECADTSTNHFIFLNTALINYLNAKDSLNSAKILDNILLFAAKNEMSNYLTSILQFNKLKYYLTFDIYDSIWPLLNPELTDSSTHIISSYVKNIIPDINRPNGVDSTALINSLKDILLPYQYYNHKIASELNLNIARVEKYYNDKISNKINSARLSNLRWVIIISSIIMVIIITILGCIWHRRSLRRKDAEITERISELRLLNDELNKERCAHQSEVTKMSNRINELLIGRFTQLNNLCDNYFNHHDSKIAKSIFYNEFEKQLSQIGSPKSILEIEKLVNEYKDNVVAKLRSDFPKIKETDITLLTLIYAGFSPRAICLLTGNSKDNYYNRRKRLISKISDSNSPNRDVIIKHLK